MVVVVGVLALFASAITAVAKLVFGSAAVLIWELVFVSTAADEPFANTAVDLAHTMIQNPNMRVLVQQGYFDLATPYGATNYFIDHMDMSPELRENIQVEFYEAGHMMYLHPPSRAKFSKDLAAFIGD